MKVKSRRKSKHDKVAIRKQIVTLYAGTIGLCLLFSGYGTVLDTVSSVEAAHQDREISQKRLTEEVMNRLTLEQELAEIKASKQLSQHQEILMYIVEKFGDRADDAIAMINQCENSALKTDAINYNIQQSGRESYDVGIFQINVDVDDTAEIEKLKDWKYNIDRAYEKYTSADNTFYHWTCGYVVKDRTYLDAIRGN